LLISSSDDASIIVWDCSESEIKQDQYVRAHTNAINHVTFDSNGKFMASCSADLSVKIWKFDNPLKCIKTLNGHEHSVSCVEFSPDGNLIYSASRDKTIRVWEVSSGFCKLTFKGHNEWVRSISLNETGTLIASASDDETIIIWSAKGEQKSIFSGHENKIEKIYFVKNETAKVHIASGDYEGSQQLVETKFSEQMEKVNELNKKLQDISKLNKKVDKEFLLSCGRDKLVKLWDLSNNLCIYTFTGHDNWVRNICIHPSGKYFFSTGDDRNLRIWDFKTGRCVKKIEKIHEKFIVGLAIHSKLNFLVTGSNDLYIKFWDCR
jgi:platelet-activating factor acetylhydrolase IB subunit alpha